MHKPDLWSYGRSYYGKNPINLMELGATIDLYPGFTWGLTCEGNRIFLQVDTKIRYVDRRWFPERLNGSDVTGYKGRHFLYHFGPQWYIVQLCGVTGSSVSKQSFQLPDQSLAYVYPYTQGKWGGQGHAWIDRMDPDGS